MGRIDVKGIEEPVYQTIRSKAKKANISDAEYVRRVLNNDYLVDELAAAEGRYKALVMQVVDTLQNNNQRIQELTDSIDQLKEELESE